MITDRILGVMSGSSLDGADLACCRFEYLNGRWDYFIEAAETVPYSDEWKAKLLQSMDMSGHELMLLHFRYGRYLGDLCRNFNDRHGTDPQYISSHGHTVFHRPDIKLTFQLGSGPAMAASSGLPVISDFRSADVEKGGQGAPLVPAGDKLLFGEYEYCLNLGGIANISVDKDGLRIAHDICPVNMVLNHLAMQAGRSFDIDGIISRSGKIDRELLQMLDKVPWYTKRPPKSLGREYVTEHFLNIIDGSDLSTEDKMRTYSEHAARRIGEMLKGTEGTRALVTGGGAFNRFFMELLREKTSCRLVVPEAELVEFKEALIFAFLGILRLNHLPNCLSSATGAASDSSSGSICHP